MPVGTFTLYYRPLETALEKKSPRERTSYKKRAARSLRKRRVITYKLKEQRLLVLVENRSSELDN